MGVCALASLALYAATAFGWVGLLVELLPATAQGYQFYNLGVAVAAIAVMLPAAFFAGATLPLFTAVLLRAGYGEGVIGRVYAWNTFGAIAGVLAAIHVLIPVLGLRDAMIVAAGIDLLLGLALLALAPAERARRLGLAAAGTLAAVAVVVSVVGVNFDPYRLASGVFRDGNPELDRNAELRYYRDGKTASVSLFRWPDGVVSLAYNGKVDASMALDAERSPSADEATNVLAAALPLALHEAPERAAVIGMGSGLTAHTLLADERVAALETIEIEQRVVEAARGFGERVARVHEDPRSDIVIDDALAALAGSGEAYDTIVSIPSNPWVAGVGNLFATEFYDFINGRLADDGLFVQWLQLYEIDEALVGSMLRALTPHFEHASAWMVNQSDLLIVAGNGDGLPALDSDRLFDSAVGAELERVGLAHPGQLDARQIAGDGAVHALSDALGEPANSFYWPRLSLEAPEARFRGVDARALRELATHRSLALELLGMGGAPPAAAGDTGAGTMEQQAAVARDRTALLEPGTERDPGAVDRGYEAELLRLWAADCAAFEDPQRRRHWLSLYSRLAAHALPLLEGDGAQPLRAAEPDWIGCEALPESVAVTLAFTAAAAARDTEAIAATAAEYLAWAEGRDGVMTPLAPTAYLAGQAALMAEGDPAAAERLRDAHGGLLDPDGRDWLVQRLLDQLRARERGAPAAASP